VATASKLETPGIPGTALLFGTVGLYLVYVGVRDVPFFDGLRQLLRRQRPSARGEHAPFQSTTGAGPTATVPVPVSGQNDQGVKELVGSAAAAYPLLKARWPHLRMLGKGLRPANPNSDHPAGKAIDVMTTNRLEHSAIATFAEGLPGFHYWISDLLDKPGIGDHSDHIHLSFD